MILWPENLWVEDEGGFKKSTLLCLDKLFYFPDKILLTYWMRQENLWSYTGNTFMRHQQFNKPTKIKRADFTVHHKDHYNSPICKETFVKFNYSRLTSWYYWIQLLNDNVNDLSLILMVASAEWTHISTSVLQFDFQPSGSIWRDNKRESNWIP